MWMFISVTKGPCVATASKALVPVSPADFFSYSSMVINVTGVN